MAFLSPSQHCQMSTGTQRTDFKQGKSPTRENPQYLSFLDTATDFDGREAGPFLLAFFRDDVLIWYRVSAALLWHGNHSCGIRLVTHR